MDMMTGKGIVLSAGTGAKSLGALVVFEIHVTAALVGTLTMTGLTAEDGTTAASLVLPIGFVGRIRVCNVAGATLQKSSASDDGKVLVLAG